MINQPFFVPATLFLLLALPLLFGWIPRNRLYGIRTVKTISDDETWNRANRYGGRQITLASLVYLAIAALLPCSNAGDADMGCWTMHLLAFLLPLAMALVAIGRDLQRN